MTTASRGAEVTIISKGMAQGGYGQRRSVLDPSSEEQ
jgi:hypothetical protein